MNERARLTCRRLVELATDYLAGALPEADRAELVAHLARCGGCRNYLDQLQRTIRLLGALAEPPPPAPAPALLAALRARRAV